MFKKCFVLLIFAYSAAVFSQNNAKFLGKAFQSKDSSDYYFYKAKKAIVNSEDEAEYYFAKNAYCNDYNKLDSAIVYGEIALVKLKAIKKVNSIFYVNNNLAKTYSKLGKYELEKKYLHSNLQLSENNKNAYWGLNSYHSLSNLHHDFEDYKNGVYYGKKGFKKALVSKEEGKEYIKEFLNVIAINYDDWNKPDSALYYHKKVFDYVKGKDTLLIGNTYNNIGNTLLKLKKFKEAESWFKRSLLIANTTKKTLPEEHNTYLKATIYINLAKIAFDQNDFTKAEKFFKLAYEYALKSNDIEKLKDYYYQSAKFNKKRRNIDLAFSDQEQYLLLRDSVFKRDKSKQIIEFETKYQVEKKEKELLQSKVNIAQKELQIKNKNIQFYILVLISIALIIISFLIYRQQKLKNKQQIQEFQLKSAIDKIESQNQLHEQRLSISRDLHDNIGAQLTFIISSVDNLKYGFKNKDEKINNQLDKINNFTKSTIVELRDTIWAMNSDEITFQNIEVRLYNFIEKAKQSNEEIAIFFNIDSELIVRKLNALEGINLYRTIQEAINNALKYAKCNQILIKVFLENEKIIIAITDNGIGFNVDEVSLGNGIMNMQKRMEEINSTFSLESSNLGTKIILILNQNLQDD